MFVVHLKLIFAIPVAIYKLQLNAIFAKIRTICIEVFIIMVVQTFKIQYFVSFLWPHTHLIFK